MSPENLPAKIRKCQELERVLRLAQKRHPLFEVQELGQVEHRGEKYPLLGFVFGPKDKNLPTFGVFGGVHGLERVGSQVVISFLESLLVQLEWNMDFCKSLETSRIIAIPLINPVGMTYGNRSNGRGVDLMRNAPVEAPESPSWLVGGHRIGPWLPWYRGDKEKMEVESQALVDFMMREGFDAPVCVSIDFHSGFGLRDRLWYPYAKTKKDFGRVAEVKSLMRLFEKTHPHHVYIIESQASSYTTHGDLWDHLFDTHEEKHKGSLYLPLSLEMGSWNWVKKNPRQIFLSTGLFNPLLPHRQSRTMRRHLMMINFMYYATKNHSAWWSSPAQREATRG